MSEAVARQVPVVERPRQDALSELLPPLQQAEDSDNDNDLASALPAGERRGFEIPRRIWWGMLACYGIFMTALLAATAGGESNLNIAISTLYMVMFFGTTAALVRQGPKQDRSPLDGASGILETIYGPLKEREVASQMLVVPVCIAFFAVAILVIEVLVG